MNQELQEQIKAFLKSELSDKERNEFIRRLESDAQLADQVRQQQQALQTQRLTRRLFMPVSIAAGIILIGIIWIVSSQDPISPLPPWAEAFAILEPGFNDSAKEGIPAFDQAMNAYNEQQYAEALDQFQALPLGWIGVDTSDFLLLSAILG